MNYRGLPVVAITSRGFLHSFESLMVGALLPIALTVNKGNSLMDG